MRWLSGPDRSNRRFIIEYDERVGYYLFVFEEESCVRDELQDSFEHALAAAERRFGVARESWRREGAH